jgi:hypothetical protein
MSWPWTSTAPFAATNSLRWAYLVINPLGWPLSPLAWAQRFRSLPMNYATGLVGYGGAISVSGPCLGMASGWSGFHRQPDPGAVDYPSGELQSASRLRSSQWFQRRSLVPGSEGCLRWP